MIEAAATGAGIPVGFFTRLIWKESSFRAEAVSPKGAQGIAQFMPETAARRQLADPFNAVEAIPASASYLKELAARFGNLGLAAAAYNAGEKRVAQWIASGGSLPLETQDYVLAITGQPVDAWLRPEPPPPPEAGLSAPRPEGNCLSISAALSRRGAGSELAGVSQTAPRAPWGVQVTGNFSLSRAMASWAALRKRFQAVLADQPPMVIRAVNRSRGTAPFFQIRIPANTRQDADAICRKLHAMGGACIVVRT